MSEIKALALGYLAVASTGRDMRPLADNPAVALLIDSQLVDGASGRITEFGRLAARHFRAQAELFFDVYVNGRLGETSAEPTATEPLAVQAGQTETQTDEVIDAT